LARADVNEYPRKPSPKKLKYHSAATIIFGPGFEILSITDIRAAE